MDGEIAEHNYITNSGNKDDFFLISRLIRNYINLAGSQGEDVINILADDYIKRYGVTKENVLTKLNINLLSSPKQTYSIIIDSIEKAELNENINIYLIEWYYRISGEDNVYGMRTIIEKDNNNKTYAIYPDQYVIDNRLDNINKINSGFEHIQKNEYNQFIEKKLEDKEMISEYFLQYAEMLNYYPDIAYKKLNSEYSNKRFKNINEFNNYIKNNTYTIVLMYANEYKVDRGTNYTDYVCSDQYNNMYIFRNMDNDIGYSVFLDNYTIMTPTEIANYNSLEKYNKATYNLTKFQRMLNTKDYSAIYNCLDSSFKNSNFKTEAALEEFLKSKIYYLNEITISDEDTSQTGYYTFYCTLQDMRNKKETKNMIITISVGEKTDFTMSFNFI